MFLKFGLNNDKSLHTLPLLSVPFLSLHLYPSLYKPSVSSPLSVWLPKLKEWQCVPQLLHTHTLNHTQTDKVPKVNIWLLVGFGRPCAPVRCAHPSFWTHCHPKGGAARPSPPSQLFLIRSPPKIKSIETPAACVKGFPENICFPTGLNLGLPRQGFFSFHWTTEAIKYEGPCPRPAHRRFPDPSGNILGSKLCTGVAFYSYLLIFLFLFFFSYIWFCLLYEGHAY